MGSIKYFPISADGDIYFKIPMLFDTDLFNASSGTYQQISGADGDGHNTIHNLCTMLKLYIPSIDNFRMPFPNDFYTHIPDSYGFRDIYLQIQAELMLIHYVPNWQTQQLDHVNGTTANMGTPTLTYTDYVAGFSQPGAAVSQTELRMTAFRFGYDVDYLNRTGSYARKQTTITIPLLPEDAVDEDGVLRIQYAQPKFLQLYFYLYDSRTWLLDVNVMLGSSSNFQYFKAWANGQRAEQEQEPSDDPYTGAGYTPSSADGGLSEGTFDFTDNGLTDVNTPGIDLLNSGFLTAWNVNKAQLNALANWLWVTTPSQIFQQIYGNPINAVIGLNVVPVAPSIDGGSSTIKFGVEDSQVAAPKITSQYVSVDCGTLTIAPVYGSYMDYGPYSSAELFLPYCGGVPLDINDVVGKTISVKYQVDILSGACVAYIFIDGHLHYQKSGCCAGTAPVTGSQMPNVISGVLSIVGSVAGAIGSLGASGASTAAKVASGIATGTNVADAATNALKRSISYSGTVSGWAGLLGAQKPYLILTLPNAAIPAGQQQLSGYPAWVGGQLSGFSGHTECASVHLNGLRATDEEMQEIRVLLESGVIL